MKRRTRIFLLCAALALALGTFALAGCGIKNSDPHQKDLLLYLSFDEGSGTVVHDGAKRVPDANLNYIFNSPAYQEKAQDPQWRARGVKGGSLLMDGYSNFVRYAEDDITVKGGALTVSAWIAPRMFEWDDPNGAEAGTERLTAVVSQFNEEANQGFILGYQRHGAWSFQVGIGDRFFKLWDNGHPLKKYEWNHIVAVFDGGAGNMRMYLNGELANERTFYEGAQISGCADWLYIGRNNHGTSNATAACNMHSGLIDEVKLYKTALTADEVRAQYSGGLSDGKLPEITFEDIWLQNVLTEDYHKPQYHGGPYQHWMNEPHAPFYYNGKYHLFFQFNLNGPYFRNICWGHLVSDDMVNWKPLKEIITPTAGTVAPDGIWSGGVNFDSKGNPVIFFTAGNDSFASAGQGLISNQNIGIARPKDLTDPNLTEWEVSSTLAVKQKSGEGKTGEFRDPFVFKDGNTWYMLVCSSSSANKGTALIYTTTDDSFTNWTYRGQLYEDASLSSDYGRTWELPVLIPVKTRDGSAQKYMFVFSPAPADSADNDVFYLLGNFNKSTCRFEPDDKTPKRFDYGDNVFTGPSAFTDPKTGKVVMFSIMQDQRKPRDQYLSGWAHSVGLAREIYLSADGKTAEIAPLTTIESYERETLAEGSSLSLAAANEKLGSAKGDMLHVKVTFEFSGSGVFGLKVRANDAGTEYTDFYYDTANGNAGVKTGMSGAQNISGTFFDKYAAEGNRLTMELYLDRSLIEAFYDGKIAVSARVYPKDRTSMGLKLYADDSVTVSIAQLKVASMKSIYKQ
ncbi:LamG-like jellyroll fold domain-containing protein [Pumilibacter muris]|uniref:LamG-like jellyroll fold domain-containing protein n=1 Tax=Pumilibacter muris TaxID=2941510 RepID=UPI00203D0878|nr:GH32 C-terminal domain-containing protein [Pumilibacter muris]